MPENTDQLKNPESASVKRNAEDRPPQSATLENAVQASTGSLFHEVKLPEVIPTRWLDDIQKAVRESRKKLIITTILSSSLLTGLIATLASYSLESKKTILQLEFEDAKDTLHQYNLLRNDINDLKYELALSASVFQMAAGTYSNDAMIQHAGTQVKSLMERTAAIKKSVAKIDDPETYKMIEDTFGPLIRELDSTESSLRDRTKQDNLAKLCTTASDEGVKNILNQINRKKRELSSGL